MSYTEWTPGPWKPRAVGGAFLQYYVLSDDGQVAWIKDRRTFDEESANAHLIAAAPKMAAALQDFLDLADNIERYGAMGHEHDWQKVKRVRDIAASALSSARGSL